VGRPAAAAELRPRCAPLPSIWAAHRRGPPCQMAVTSSILCIHGRRAIRAAAHRDCRHLDNSAERGPHLCSGRPAPVPRRRAADVTAGPPRVTGDRRKWARDGRPDRPQIAAVHSSRSSRSFRLKVAAPAGQAKAHTHKIGQTLITECVPSARAVSWSWDRFSLAGRRRFRAARPLASN
jgi:hypothetical protein